VAAHHEGLFEAVPRQEEAAMVMITAGGLAAIRGEGKVSPWTITLPGE